MIGIRGQPVKRKFATPGGPGRTAPALPARSFEFPLTTWVQILYELVTPLYYARVANFVRRTWNMTSEEAEQVVDEQALEFEAQKDYLIKIWDEKKAAAGT